MTIPAWEISKKKCPNCKKHLNKVTHKNGADYCGYCGYGLLGMLSGGPAYAAGNSGDGGGQTGGSDPGTGSGTGT